MLFSKIALVATWWRFSLAAVATEDDNCAGTPDEDMLSGTSVLLQHSGKTPPTLAQLHSAAGKCLNFLHIPKNAGASMENIRREQQKNLTQTLGPFTTEQLDDFKAGNRPLPWIDADHSGWGWGESMVMSKLNCEESGDDGHACVLHDKSGHSGMCPKFHVPPDYDSAIAAGYEGCDTFCISRHPLTKAVSQHIFVGGKCDAADFAEKVKQVSTELQSDPFGEDCHWVPQTKYTKTCQRILRFEHLPEDFNSLMQEYGYDFELIHNDHGFSHCDLGEHPELIPPETLEGIHEYYASDLAELGYASSSAE